MAAFYFVKMISQNKKGIELDQSGKDSVCPVHNIVLKENRAVPGEKYTMCYRCISLCPQKAITLFGKGVIEPCRIEKYQ